MKYSKNKGKNCIAPDCNEKAICKGYCAKHYQQINLTGKLKTTNAMFIQGNCKILGCGDKTVAKGFCQKHYRQERVRLSKTDKVLINGEWCEASPEFSKICNEINDNLRRK